MLIKFLKYVFLLFLSLSNLISLILSIYYISSEVSSPLIILIINSIDNTILITLLMLLLWLYPEINLIKSNQKALDFQEIHEIDETLLNPMPPKTNKRKKLLIYYVFLFYILSISFLIISGNFLNMAKDQNIGNLFLFNLIINTFLDFIILVCIVIKSALDISN